MARKKIQKEPLGGSAGGLSSTVTFGTLARNLGCIRTIF